MTNKTTILITVIALWLTAWASAGLSQASTPTPTATSLPPSPSPVPAFPTPAAYAGQDLLREKGDLFNTSGTCSRCHSNMEDEAGTDVSIDSFWRSTMMANAARDPYWQASVQDEIFNFPAYQAVIEDTCATCHMPMARFTAHVARDKGQIFAEGFLNPVNELHALAMDAVSCTLCHQIEAANLGQEDSFSGGFVINPDLPTGERLNYGPYLPSKSQIKIMQKTSGFIPVQSQHIQQAELCATCHTLYTPTIDTTGQIVGRFPEQMAYFEWQHSDYRDNSSCQGCHMPEVEGGVIISKVGKSEPRSSFSQHTFVGGNAYMATLLATFGEELGVTASSEQFTATITRTLAQLQQRTATVSLDEMSRSETGLRARVLVKSLAGHKFPTGFPARRAWLRLTVQDATGQVVFESGGFNQTGAITGNDNDADPSAYEPHYTTIKAPDQVQIYEAILQDVTGKVTTTLLRGAGYVKDNRLLPAGFDKSTAQADIAVRGLAADDPNMAGGEDQVEYVIDLNEAQTPLTVTVELLYQSIGYRWRENLREHDAPEIARFLGYSERVPNVPVIVASETVTIE